MLTACKFDPGEETNSILLGISTLLLQLYYLSGPSRSRRNHLSDVRSQTFTYLWYDPLPLGQFFLLLIPNLKTPQNYNISFRAPKLFIAVFRARGSSRCWWVMSNYSPAGYRKCSRHCRSATLYCSKTRTKDQELELSIHPSQVA